MGLPPGRPDTSDDPEDNIDPPEPSGRGLRNKDHTRQMMEKTYLDIFGPNGSLAVYARKLKYVSARTRR